jgi:hypothetical protein
MSFKLQILCTKRNGFQNAPIAKTRAMGYRNNKYLWQIKAQLAGMSLCIYPL